MSENKEKFYKNKGFWTCLFGTLSGIIAGEAGAITGIANIFNYIVGG